MFRSVALPLRNNRVRNVLRFCFRVAVATVALVLTWAVPARAEDCTYNPATQGSYAMSLSVPGLPNGGVYGPVCFSWGPAASSTGEGVSRELSVTTYTDNTVSVLMNAAQSKQLFPTAELQQAFQYNTYPGVVSIVTVDIQMANVRIESVRITGNSQNPQTVMTLRFDSVVFTFQPVLPNGQKAGPPVSFSTTFKK